MWAKSPNGEWWATTTADGVFVRRGAEWQKHTALNAQLAKFTPNIRDLIWRRDGELWIASGRDGHRTKSGKGRWGPRTPRLRQAMREHFARFRFATYDGQCAPWVFHHVTTRRQAKAGQRIGVLRRAFENGAERAKLPK